MRHTKSNRDSVVAQLLGACRKHGIPKTFWTDVAWDVDAVERHPGESFVWYLYDQGTYIEFDTRVFPTFVKETYPKGRWFRCDGATLRTARGAS